MIVMHELQEPLPVEVKHLGKGLAILVECGTHDYKWTIVFDTRAIVSVPQSKVLVQKDFTNGRGITAKELRKIIEGVINDSKGRGIHILERALDESIHRRRRRGIRLLPIGASFDASCRRVQEKRPRRKRNGKTKRGTG